MPKPTAQAGASNMTVTAGPEFARAVEYLRGPAGADLRASMKRELDAEVQAGVKTLREAVRGVKVSGGGGGGQAGRAAAKLAGRSVSASTARRARAGAGLRDTVAAAVTGGVRITGSKVGGAIYVDTRKMPDGQKGLPRYLDGQARWRHPVWGNTEVWVTQTVSGGGGWWSKNIQQITVKLRAAGQRISDAAIDDLTRSL